MILHYHCERENEVNMLINFGTIIIYNAHTNKLSLYGITRIPKYSTRISKLSVIILLPPDELLIPNRCIDFRLLDFV